MPAVATLTQADLEQPRGVPSCTKPALRVPIRPHKSQSSHGLLPVHTALLTRPRPRKHVRTALARSSWRKVHGWLAGGPWGHEPGGAGLSLRGPDAAVPGGLVIFSSSFLRRMSLPDSGFAPEASKQTNKQTGRWNGTALPHLHRDWAHGRGRACGYAESAAALGGPVGFDFAGAGDKPCDKRTDESRTR